LSLNVSLQYNKANGKGNGCVFTVHDFAGIKWSVDTAIEFHEDINSYALLRCNAWDSVIDLEEVFVLPIATHYYKVILIRFHFVPAGLRRIYTRVRHQYIASLD
jgi:hypothetical protein